MLVSVLDRQLSCILARSPFCRSSSGDFRLTDRPSCRNTRFQWCCREERSTPEKCAGHIAEFEKNCAPESHVQGPRSCAFFYREFSLGLHFSISRSCDSTFSAEGKTQFLGIFQNFPDNRIRILQALVACSECQLYYTLLVPTRTRPRFGG